MQRLKAHGFLQGSLAGMLCCLALLGLLLGCGDETNTSTRQGANPSPNPFQPKGNIQGVVRDAVSGQPIAGAVVSIDVPGSSRVTVTTRADGQYSFTNVPASVWSDAGVILVGDDLIPGTNDDVIIPADGQVQFGELSTYTVTVDLTGVNEDLPAGTASYPSFATGPAAVGFSSFLEGNAPACPAGGAGNCTEGGSGANTPIDGLTTTLNFDLGAKTETIRGLVRNAQTGDPIPDATVTLLDAAVPPATPAPPAVIPPPNAIRLSLDNTTTTVTTGADGTFAFTEVPASHGYNVEVVATGFVPNGTLTCFLPVVLAAPAPCPPGGGIVFTLGGGLEVLVPATPARGSGVGTGFAGLPPLGEIFLVPPEPGVDVVAPFPTASDPADGADIDITGANARRPVVLTFNEPMQTDNAFTQPIVATVDFKGLPVPVGGVSGPDGQVAITSEFNADGTVLTITPVNDWQPGLTYGVAVGAVAGGFLGNVPLADLRGNTCCNSTPPNVLGDLTSGTGTVFGEAVPSPGLLLFTTNGGPGVLAGPAATLGDSSADFNSTSATINWDAVDGARAYRVYMSIAGGEFQIIAQTLPGNDPVTTLPATAWSMNAALAFALGVNPGVALGYDGVARNVVEATITDVGDDVSPTVPIDTPNGLADLSDGFDRVRIAISVLNSNDVEGALGSPVVVEDNTGPTTNGGVAQVGAGATAIQTLNGTAGPPAAGALATLSRGQALLDIDGDGAPDAILLGFSEPLAEVTAENPANYQLRAADGSTPARLAEITITAAMLNEEIAGADGVFTSADDIDGDGLQDTGQDVDGNGTKGNAFGNTFVTLVLTPGPSGVIDIQQGDFVALSLTSVQDLNGNANQQTDPTEPTNQLPDLVPPFIANATIDAANNMLVINFNEPLSAIVGIGGPGTPPQVTIAGIPCTTAGTVVLDPAFAAGDSSITLVVTPGAADPTNACDLSRLGAGDFVGPIGAADQATPPNPIDPTRDTLVFNDATGVFDVTDAVPPPDTTAPLLTAAVITDNDTITLTFSERIGTFLGAVYIIGAPPTVLNCSAVVSTPAFIRGDTTVALEIDISAATGNPQCQTGNLTTANAGLIALGPPTVGAPTVRDIANNPLSDTADHAVFANGAFSIAAGP